jgi:hypothetical protein
MTTARLGKRQLCVLALLPIGLLAGGLPIVFSSRVDSRSAKCARISEGMSLDQVEVILGGSPGDYRSYPKNVSPVWLGGGITLERESIEPEVAATEFWAFDEGLIEISFDKNGKVIWKDWHSDCACSSFIERGRGFIGF